MQFTLNDLIWMIPLGLFILILLQLLYILFLRYAPVRAAQEPRQPVAPIMPAIYTQTAAAAPPATPVAPAVAATQATPQYAPTLQPTAAPRSNSPITGKMIILGGLDTVKEVALPSSNFAVGRFFSPENNILIGLDEKSISRKHAVFMGDEGLREYYLKDTNSSFGTAILINGTFEPLTPEKQERLYNEDVVQFGNAITVRFILPCETRSAVTT